MLDSLYISQKSTAKLLAEKCVFLHRCLCLNASAFQTIRLLVLMNFKRLSTWVVLFEGGLHNMLAILHLLGRTNLHLKSYIWRTSPSMKLFYFILLIRVIRNLEIAYPQLVPGQQVQEAHNSEGDNLSHLGGYIETGTHQLVGKENKEVAGSDPEVQMSLYWYTKHERQTRWESTLATGKQI